jgi:arginine decarboxylase
MTCDSDDYYNSEQNMMPFICQNITKKNHYIGFFNTGAYQETIGGCMVYTTVNSTTQTHIIDRDENGILATEVFSEQQTSKMSLKY